jgi:hypothetical protein
LTQPHDPPPPETDADLDQWIEEVVDTLPPLTEEQRDLLALIFRKHRS